MITEAYWFHPLGNINVCIKFQSNSIVFEIFQSRNIKVVVDHPLSRAGSVAKKLLASQRFNGNHTHWHHLSLLILSLKTVNPCSFYLWSKPYCAFGPSESTPLYKVPDKNTHLFVVLQMAPLGTAWEDTIMAIVFTTLSRTTSLPPKHNQRLCVINSISHWKYNFKVCLMHEKAMVHSNLWFPLWQCLFLFCIAFEKKSLIIQVLEDKQRMKRTVLAKGTVFFFS